MKKITRILQISAWSLLIVFFLILCIQETEAKIITVDDGGGQDYTKIQDAIDNSVDGDTIRVYIGYYNENVVINKSIKMIGNGSENTIIDSNEYLDVVDIKADYVEISKFLIKGSGVFYSNGVKLSYNDNNKISNCIISNNHYGLSLTFSGHNIITNCNFINNDVGTNIVDSCINNIISNCNISDNTRGIYIHSSNYNTFSNCNIVNNSYRGIDLYYSNSNKISSCKISKSRNGGIQIYSSTKNKISDSIITNNRDGIIFSYSNDSVISYCNISNNDEDGVYFSRAFNNTISMCNILKNDVGIAIWLDCENNLLFHNNFIDNNRNAHDKGKNYWNNDKEGNYWDDYDGMDKNGDGIGETPYDIDISLNDNKDYYPLIEPFTVKEDVDKFPKIVLLFLVFLLILILLIFTINFWYPTKN